MDFVGAHRLRPEIQASWPMGEVRAGLDALAAGGHLGKLVLSIP